MFGLLCCHDPSQDSVKMTQLPLPSVEDLTRHSPFGKIPKHLIKTIDLLCDSGNLNHFTFFSQIKNIPEVMKDFHENKSVKAVKKCKLSCIIICFLEGPLWNLGAYLCCSYFWPGWLEFTSLVGFIQSFYKIAKWQKYTSKVTWNQMIRFACKITSTTSQ